MPAKGLPLSITTHRGDKRVGLEEERERLADSSSWQRAPATTRVSDPIEKNASKAQPQPNETHRARSWRRRESSLAVAEPPWRGRWERTAETDRLR